VGGRKGIRRGRVLLLVRLRLWPLLVGKELLRDMVI
jgi:hypothetical protein